MNEIMALLGCFLQIGLLSIGGGYATIPLIQQQVVSANHWLSLQEFTDIITISQMTPGPLAVNTSTFVGIRIAGLSGAVAATLGCILCGFLLSLFLDRFFQTHRESRSVSRLLGGLRACSTGLIAASAATLVLIALFGAAELPHSLQALNPIALALFAAAFYLLRRRKLNPILVMALSGAAGLALYL